MRPIARFAAQNLQFVTPEQQFVPKARGDELLCYDIIVSKMQPGGNN